MFLLNCLKRKCIPDSKIKAVFMDPSGSFWLLSDHRLDGRPKQTNKQTNLRDRSQVVLSEVFRLLTSKNFCAVK